MFPYWTVWGHTLPTYGFFSALGIVVSLVYILLTARAGRAGQLPAIDVSHLLVVAILGAVAGAKLLYLGLELPYILQNWQAIAASPAALLSLVNRGFVFYGGLWGGLLALWVYCRRYCLDFAQVCSVCVPVIPLFHVFGRVGCFFAGCCWGRPSAVCGVVFPPGSAGPVGVPLFPIQLVEATGNLLLFVFLAVFSRRTQRRWMVLPLYLSLYGCMRFALEFFRGDASRGVFILSTSQWISLLTLIGAPLYFWLRVRRERDTSHVF